MLYINTSKNNLNIQGCINVEDMSYLQSDVTRCIDNNLPENNYG